MSASQREGTTGEVGRRDGRIHSSLAPATEFPYRKPLLRIKRSHHDTLFQPPCAAFPAHDVDRRESGLGSPPHGRHYTGHVPRGAVVWTRTSDHWARSFRIPYCAWGRCRHWGPESPNARAVRRHVRDRRRASSQRHHRPGGRIPRCQFAVRFWGDDGARGVAAIVCLGWAVPPGGPFAGFYLRGILFGAGIIAPLGLPLGPAARL